MKFVQHDNMNWPSIYYCIVLLYIIGTRFEEGIVDSNNVEEYTKKLASLKIAWEERLFDKGIQLYTWFNQYQSLTMKNCMLKPLRISAGLGNPPQPFTTNRVESINNLLKKETNGPLPVNQCVQKIKQLVERQQRNVRWAIIEKGPYKLHPDYIQYRVDPSEWVNWSEVYIYIPLFPSTFLFVYFLYKSIFL